MEVSFDKQMERLEREVLLKSVDLDDNIEDFNFELDSFHSNDKIITISPNCVRCNLCVQECPVNAIEPSNIFKHAKIKNNCVQCEICVQTCPISCIKLIEANTILDDGYLRYDLSEIVFPHRIVRMEEISVDLDKCNNCGNCAKYCPTNALKLEFIEERADDKLYPVINDKLCIGCGSCDNLCDEGAINLKRYLGPVLDTKNLIINQDICVNCFLCEENCPVEAIKVTGDGVKINRDKCIRCNSCTTRCPVGALQLVSGDL